MNGLTKPVEYLVATPLYAFRLQNILNRCALLPHTTGYEHSTLCQGEGFHQPPNALRLPRQIW